MRHTENPPLSAARASESEDHALRVLLVDDHVLFRRGLRALLETHGIDVIGEAGNGRLGVALAVDLAPDVVVMDLSMPVMSGVEATRDLMASAPDSRILIVTVSSTEADVLEALLAGACGYLLKDAPVDQFMTSIRAASVGESFISPAVAGRLVQRLRTDVHEHVAPDGLAERLTQRELDVLSLLAQGYENHEIADALFMSTATVKRHVSAILEKLHLHNRIQAAVYAVRHQLA